MANVLENMPIVIHDAHRVTSRLIKTIIPTREHFDWLFFRNKYRKIFVPFLAEFLQFHERKQAASSALIDKTRNGLRRN